MGFVWALGDGALAGGEEDFARARAGFTGTGFDAAAGFVGRAFNGGAEDFVGLATGVLGATGGFAGGGTGLVGGAGAFCCGGEARG